MSVDVLGVHGVGNWQRSAPTDSAISLGRKWSESLGMASVAAAYYAHHLRLDHQGGDDLDLLDRTLGGAPAELLAGWMRKLGWGDEAAQGRALAPIRQLASWWVRRFGVESRVVDQFLGTFLGEVVRYFDPYNPFRRQAVRTEVATAMSSHRPRIVIAHSLGSVVAYETLWAYPTLRVELLVTVGSPLALPDRIHPLLQPTPIGGMGRRPPGVRRWVNIADPADLVAIPAGLAGHFHEVDADMTIPAGPLFTHAVASYLASERLRDIVHQHLAGC
ncbi:serine peptidase [Amycolatopsis sp. lyj-84]|uniref:serine peptidase n=1 Tax=Amycolatopsis sp. lyj-84 TaxID=2789284 RepID=UPI00397892F9